MFSCFRRMQKLLRTLAKVEGKLVSAAKNMGLQVNGENENRNDGTGWKNGDTITFRENGS